MTAARKILLFSGHMTDLPDRAEPRFPPAKSRSATAAMETVLARWKIGPGDPCLCGGARGGDILCAEAALRRGADLELWLPMETDAFVAASVRTVPDDPARWEARFDALLAAAGRVSVLGPADGEDANAFARNNLRMLARATELARDGALHVLLLWDGQAGDGPGGTADMARAARDAGAKLEIIAPADL